MAMITRETDYAIRFLRDLSDGKLKSVTDICSSQHMPKSFGYKIIKKLQKAGMVRIARGSQGGITLSVDLEQITLYDIMYAMDSSQFVSECLKPGYVCEYASTHNCSVHCKMIEVQSSMDNLLKSFTLKSMLT